MSGLHEMPDSAYGHHPAWDDDLDFEDMSRGHYDRLKSQFDTPEANADRDDAAWAHDEDSGYNWGPPPDHDLEPPEPPEVDTHYDPDHGREDHRTGAILRQSEQWALHQAARGTQDELSTSGHGQQHHDGIQYLKDTGLYGEDEDHPYKGVIGKPSPHGNGYDVVRVVE
jgi:hypothetical protein